MFDLMEGGMNTVSVYMIVNYIHLRLAYSPIHTVVELSLGITAKLTVNLGCCPFLLVRMLACE